MRRGTIVTVVLSLGMVHANAWGAEKGALQLFKERYRPTNVQFAAPSAHQQRAGQVFQSQAVGQSVQTIPQQADVQQEGTRAISTRRELTVLPVMPGAVDYAIYQTEYQASIEDDIAFVEERLKLEVFKKGGVTSIPLVNANVGLKGVTLNKRPSLVGREGNTYTLLIEKPGRYEVHVQFFAKVNRERERGPGSFTFSAVPSPISLLDVEIAEPDLDIFVEPSIKVQQETQGTKTVAAVVLPHTEWIQVKWTKAARRVELPSVKMEPKLYVDTTSLVSIGEGVAQVGSILKYSILQSEVSSFKILFPEEIAILDVQGPDLRDWKVVPENGKQVLDVYLTRGMKGTYQLKLQYEKTIGEGSVTATLPEMVVMGVEREKGLVGIQARTNVEIGFSRLSNATEIDVKELPQELWNQAAYPVLLAYKYLKHPVEVEIAVTKHEEVPVLIAAIDTAHYVSLLTREGKLLTGATYEVRNNVKQFMRLSLPAGATFLSCFVSGNPVKPAQDAEGRILVPLEKSETVGETVARFPVEIMYLMERPALGMAGQLEMRLPKLDIPATQLYWSVYLPEEFNYWRFRGDVKLARQEAPLGLLQGVLRGRTSAVSLGTQYAAQSAWSASNVQTAEQTYGKMKMGYTKGALPIKITIPTAGQVERFSKLLVTDESPWVSAMYVRNVRQARGPIWWALFTMILIAGALIGRRALRVGAPFTAAQKALVYGAVTLVPLGLWLAQIGLFVVQAALIVLGFYLLSVRWSHRKPRGS